MVVRKVVIERYLKQDIDGWNKIKKDLLPLVGLINSSGEEFSLQLRENYFNIYYQGNSLAKVVPNKNGTYTVLIHQEFTKNGVREKLQAYSINNSAISTEVKNKYDKFRVSVQNLRPFFQRNNLNSLASQIRKVHSGEEITMEQVIITDNPPSSRFIIIDRQVADHVSKAQIDLLALKQDPRKDKFHFVVIEVKLGKNPELRQKVGKQLSGYVEHIQKYIKDYVDCYRENYRQKRELGLFNAKMPDTIEINDDVKSVEGMVAVCGYSGIAEENIKSLNKAIERNHWNIRVLQMMMMPKLG